MTAETKRVIWCLATFLMVCAAALFVVILVFGNFRFSARANVYNAEFHNVSGLRTGNLVRVAGVEVGKVSAIVVNPDATVHVAFSADPAAVLTRSTRAEVRYDDLIGGRYLSLVDGPGDSTVLQPGQTIPVERTAPALDLESVTGGFRPLFRALSPQQVNDLSGQLVQALQGEGPTIESFLNQAAAATNTLADRDQLVGRVIDNLNVVLRTVGGQSDQLDTAVGSLSELIHGLAERKADISDAVAHTDAAARSIADLLTQVRPPARDVVAQTDRVAGIVVADHHYVESLLDGLPEAYQKLNRQGMYGDYFSFYFCDVVLKLNGKGGQPVFVKVAGQATGRCAPK